MKRLIRFLKGYEKERDVYKRQDEDSVRKELGIKKHIFGYSQAELERKANGEKVFPHVFGLSLIHI